MGEAKTIKQHYTYTKAITSTSIANRFSKQFPCSFNKINCKSNSDLETRAGRPRKRKQHDFKDVNINLPSPFFTGKKKKTRHPNSCKGDSKPILQRERGCRPGALLGQGQAARSPPPTMRCNSARPSSWTSPPSPAFTNGGLATGPRQPIQTPGAWSRSPAHRT